MDNVKTVWIACGGTGGHFLPGMVCGKQLEQEGYHVEYWGEGKAIEKHLCEDHGLILNRPNNGGGRIKRGKELFLKLLKSKRKSKPVLCILCGGYTSLITGVFAFLTRTPYVILEQNSIPGKINRLLSRFSKIAFMTYPKSQEYMRCQSLLTGNPVRDVIVSSDKDIDVLIIGGSQGASALNQNCAKLIDGSLRIFHICGPGKLNECKNAWAKTQHNVQIEEKHSNIPVLASKSKWVITRAGATSLSELAVASAAIIAVPYPSASDNHQLENARYLQNLNAAILLEEKNFEENKGIINGLINDPLAYIEYGKNLHASQIADVNGLKIIACLKKDYLPIN